MKSPKPRNKAQRKVDLKDYDAIAMSRNYEEKLSASMLWRGRCGNYRDTGVSKNVFTSELVSTNGYKTNNVTFHYILGKDKNFNI